MIAEEKESLKLQHFSYVFMRQNNAALIQSTRNTMVLQYLRGHKYFWETDMQYSFTLVQMYVLH